MSDSKKDNIVKMMGIVKKVKGGGSMEVELENGLMIDCQASGKMKKFNVRIILGDEVEVEMSTYDLKRGRITKRLLNKPVEENKN